MTDSPLKAAKLVPRVKIETALFDIMGAEIAALRDKLRPEMDRLSLDPRVVAGTHHVTTDIETRDNERLHCVEVIATPRIVETIRFDES